MTGDDSNTTTLLSSLFVLYPKKATAQVTLTNKEVIIQIDQDKNKYTETISLDDIIGCHVLEGNHTTGCDWYLCIFSYPLKKKLFKGMIRHRITRSLGIVLSKDRNNNKEIAEKWKSVIKYLISGKSVTKSEVESVVELSPRRYIVYVNPFSGQGKAMEMYNGPVRSMLAEAEVKHKMIKTKYAGHAKEMVKEVNLSDWDGIIIVSGDGLVHEVINGLMERRDWKTAIKTPIGIVPGGSGNALAASVIYASTGLHPVPSSTTSSVFHICRGAVKDLDIMAIETISQNNPLETRVTYGVLGVVVGLIADIDIDSEHLRKFGEGFRTALYGVLRVLTFRSYKMNVSYLPMGQPPSVICENNETTPQSKQTVEPAANNQNLAAGDTYPPLHNDLLAPLNQPLPKSWREETGEYLMVSGVNLSHLSQDAMIHKNLEFGDGTIQVAMMRSGMNRRTLIKLWGALEDGSGIVDDPSGHTEVQHCSAFRISPGSDQCKITLDGEKVPFGPLQCQVHHALGRIFSTA
ncbi:sphingosine kinase 1 isoform X2 [Ciona intestinalis]